MRLEITVAIGLNFIGSRAGTVRIFPGMRIHRVFKRRGAGALGFIEVRDSKLEVGDTKLEVRCSRLDTSNTMKAQKCKILNVKCKSWSTVIYWQPLLLHS